MFHLIRSLWHEPSPIRPPRRWVRDWALVGLLFTAAIVEWLVRAGQPHLAVAVLLEVGLLPTLLWRRSHPLFMVAIAFSVTALAPLFMGGTKTEPFTLVYLLLLPYCLFRWGSGRASAIGTLFILGNLGLALALEQVSLSDTIGGAGVVMAVCALGAAVRYRSRARQRDLEQVKLVEREQLARDLHDTVAHHVSAMAIRAQAGLAVAETQPHAAVEALHLIEAEATRALAELRSMVRVLRHDAPADLGPQPRITDLERLAGRTGSGPAVEVQLTGDLTSLPSAVDTAVYRLVQESLTNARRHARHATRVTVTVAADDDSVRLSVSDDGESVPAHSRAGAGYGLTGMYERANLLGGSCTAGPGPVRGWIVAAVLPRAVPAA